MVTRTIIPNLALLYRIDAADLPGSRCQVSEDLILGLGAGVGFVYWHTRGTDPFLGGRANVGRSGEEGMEITASRRLGVTTRVTQGGSTLAAQKGFDSTSASWYTSDAAGGYGVSAIFQDIGDFHFGGHMIAAVGLDLDRNR